MKWGNVERSGVGSKKWLSVLWNGRDMYWGRWVKRTRNKKLQEVQQKRMHIHTCFCFMFSYLQGAWDYFRIEKVHLRAWLTILKQTSHDVLAYVLFEHCSAGTTLVLAGCSCLACCFVFVSWLLVIPQLSPWWQEVQCLNFILSEFQIVTSIIPPLDSHD